jgi:hypothetical protein
MSVPEHIRYRNSTMFVGKPPFGYEGTEDRTFDACSSWHPPRTPPHNMSYRENYCTVPRSGTETHPRSRSRGKSPSPKSDGPDVKPDEIAPALSSSPRLDPGLAQHSDEHPSANQLSVKDSQHDPGKCGNVFGVGGTILLRATRSMRPLTPAKQNMHWETLQRARCLSPSS